MVQMKMRQRFTGGNETEIEPGADRQKNLLVAAGNPSYAEVRRRGDGWTVQTVTLFAPLTAIPTTTAILELYNNSKDKQLVVSDLFASHILSSTIVQSHAIYAMVTTQKDIPSFTALSVHSLSGKEVKVTTATSELITDIGSTVIANGWRPWGVVQNFGLGAATAGESWSVPVDGKLSVPPGAALALHVVGSINTASSFQVGADFDWVSANLEA